MDAREPLFRLSKAAHMADVSVIRFRNTIDRGHLRFDADFHRETTAKHRRFSLLDCLRLSLFSRLCEFGVPTNWAAELAHAMLADCYGANYLHEPMAVERWLEGVKGRRYSIRCLPESDVRPYQIHPYTEREPFDEGAVLVVDLEGMIRLVALSSDVKDEWLGLNPDDEETT